jgi:rare lipoprotein A (peptidoglycan hydrolase)
VRTRIIVAIAALMAASALVAAPGPAGSKGTSEAAGIDQGALTPVSIALPASAASTATYERTTATASANRLGPASPLVEPAVEVEAPVKPAIDQPDPKGTKVSKNYWRFDPNISWYGPGFYGSGTACGQKYTREIMGVAHRTLPCGTLVTLRNPKNGRQVTVPVIDRGPYVAGRTWDMSGGLCTYLDHCYTGPIEWRFGS